MNVQLYDTRGEAIVVGSTILYAVKHSTFVTLTEATVEGFWTRSGEYDGITRHIIRARRVHDKKAVELYKTDTIVVVDPRVNVPEGALLARVELWDGAKRAAHQHIVSSTTTMNELQGILKHHTFPYLVESLVDAFQFST